MSMSGAERQRNRRQRLKAEGLPDSSRTKRKQHDAKYREKRREHVRFIGVDGEGCGENENGQQNYMLFRMGDRELYTGERLTSVELLDFILDQPAGGILVAYGSGYDATMILRDLPINRLRPDPEHPESHTVTVCGPRRQGNASNYTWWRNYDIEWLPKNYLKVRRARSYIDEEGKERREADEGSTRIIYEVIGFFQKAFVTALADFEIAPPAVLEIIKKNKDNRSKFEFIDQEVRDYCAMECRYLADLMTTFRGHCLDASEALGVNILPRTWNGAGKIATALHKAYGTPKGSQLKPLIPEDVWTLADAAYYGGRFEISRTGMICEEVHEYDINSAYPAAMRSLPCLVHGKWERFEGAVLPKSGEIYVAEVSFGADKSWNGGNNFGKLAGLPIRTSDAYLYWPLMGRGTYWSCEIESAKRLGTKVTKVWDGWRYVKSCDCQQFGWIEDVYEFRRSIGKSGAGYPIKLGLNSLYGKLAQRIGMGEYSNLIWAGMITAQVRATLNEAIALNQGRIIMVATDAIYSLDPIPELEVGYWLGSWDHKVLDSMFIIQPGVYWDSVKAHQEFEEQKREKSFKRKSRGFSAKYFENEEAVTAVENIWADYQASINSNLEVSIPTAEIRVNTFTGLKLALARGKLDTAGTWIGDDPDDPARRLHFDWRRKRAYHRWEGKAVVTGPHTGGTDVISVKHKDAIHLAATEEIEGLREIGDAQPDPIDFGPPFKD